MTIEAIPYKIICTAVNGDMDAISAVTSHYSSYIKTLSLRPCFNEYGNIGLRIDEQLRQRLETRLITAILKFRL